MTEIMQKLSHLLYENLMGTSPVLSGNTRDHIRIKDVSDHKVVYEINARYYDMSLWLSTGQIRYTNEAYYKYKGQMRKKIIGQTYIKRYNKTTGELKLGVYKATQGKQLAKISYANDVNNFGGFFTNNASKYWVNKACKLTCDIVGNEYKADVDNRLPL